MIDLTSLRFVVVGAGRLGSSLALALRDHGALLVGFSAATEEGRHRAEDCLGGRAAGRLAELVAGDPDLYFLTVPDRALPVVAAQLGRALSEVWARNPSTGPRPGRPVVVAHTSGATSVRVLADCREAGADTLAFHPLQTFSDPTTGRGRFAGAAVALTPDDTSPGSPAAELGFALARTLELKPFLLADGKRTLYHAAATVACNYLVTLEHGARRLFAASGLPEDGALAMFLPLVQATLDNISSQGTVAALTGPLSRGDLDTVAAHLEALREDAPDLLLLYRVLGLATLDVVRERGDIAPESVDELAVVLTQPSQPAMPGA